jgi:hypothetical protein
MPSPALIYGAGLGMRAINSIPDVRKIFVHNPLCKLAEQYELQKQFSRAAKFAGGS